MPISSTAIKTVKLIFVKILGTTDYRFAAKILGTTEFTHEYPFIKYNFTSFKPYYFFFKKFEFYVDYTFHNFCKY